MRQQLIVHYSFVNGTAGLSSIREGGWQVLVSIRKLLQGITSWPIHTPPVTMTYFPCKHNAISGHEQLELLSFSHLVSFHRRMKGMAFFKRPMALICHIHIYCRRRMTVMGWSAKCLCNLQMFMADIMH